MPIRLPEEFDLTVEVWGDRETLTRTRVVGLTPGPSAAGNDGDEPAAWHVVGVRRRPSGLSLRVDGLPRGSGPDETPVTAWLSVEPPPGREGRFRKLVLTWGPDA